MKITYVSDNAAEYVAGLKAAQSLDTLREFVKQQRFIANDAYAAVGADDFDWNEFCRGRKLENKGEYAGDEWAKRFGAVLMPEILIRVGIVAHTYGVPWGCAYIRMRDEGMIQETKTHAKLVKAEGETVE